MALEDDTIFGFSEPVARELDNLRGSLDREHKEWHEVSNDGVTLYKAIMKSTWSAGVVSCDIYSIDGVTFTDTTIDANVYDGLSIFTGLTTGDSMLVLFQGGKYYAIQAPCP